MPTTSDLIEDTLRHLFTGHREERNVLSTPVGVADTTLAFTGELRGIKPGAVVEVDLELMYVQAVGEAAKTATVIRGEHGSVAAAHPAGAKVTVNPKFPRHDVLQALNDDLRDLSSPVNGLFRVRTVDVAFNASVRGYDLAGVTDILELQELRYEAFGSSRSWPEVRGFELARSMDPADFASGLALFLGHHVPGGADVRVRYRAPFGTLQTLADDVVLATGLAAEAVDLPPLGAALRMTAGRPVKRAFTETQGEPRRAEEVGVQDELISSRGIASTRTSRVVAEAARLARLWPRRTR